MALRVNVVCRNLNDDRVIPRFSRYLRDRLGWSLTAAPDPQADVVYLSGYFEVQVCPSWPEVPVAAYFTHREEEPPGNDKAKLFDRVAWQVDLRIATAGMYAELLGPYGATVQMPPPVEREILTLSPSSRGRGGKVVAGFSGYTYRNRRKGEDLVSGVLASKIGQKLEWMASGRGWPVPTKMYPWKQMPAFYQGLDVLVVTSRVEGVPMPPLEALSCGVSVVVPRGVGLLDELPDVLGIHRYDRGDVGGLIQALEEAVEARPRVEREALRAVTEPYSVEAWCEEHRETFEGMWGSETGNVKREASGVKRQTSNVIRETAGAEEVEVEVVGPVERGTGSKRGIYCVAFGDPARECAGVMMESAKKWMPEIPICLCAAKKIGPEDLLVVQPDSDVGGRRAKLKAYELAPAEWESVLYLDADTEVVGDIRLYFQLIEDGWEFVICKDPHLMDTMHNFRRKNNILELDDTAGQIHTLHTLQYNGGVWAFGRNAWVARFFARWQAEWEKYAQRDQGALIRAMYTEPLRVYVLGNEWNTFEKYCRGLQTAGLMHYPGRARRWSGMIPGRIDSPEAWEMVKKGIKN